MNASGIFNLLGATVVLTGVIAVFTNPNSSGTFKALGESWAGVLTAATGGAHK